MLRGLRGFEVTCGGSTARGQHRSGRTVYARHRCLWLFVDGAYVDGEIDEILSAREVGAVEFYASPAEVPTTFQSPRGGACSALVVWTRPRV
jgi:hypothetical protein